MAITFELPTSIEQQLRGEWESMSPQDREAAIGKLRELQSRLAGLTDSERSEIASAINSLNR